jgi:nucleoside phosphorylase
MKVDIAIITIREDEFKAVRSRFKTKRQRIPDGRTYLIGEVKTEKQTYTIAIARCIEQGTDASQRLAHYIIHHLNPRLILVVGIAGGIPHDEFTLGDVIVSTRIVNLNVDAWQADGSTDYITRGGPPHPSVEDIVSLLPGDPQLENWTDSIQLERPHLDPGQASIKGDDKWCEKVLKSLNLHFGKEENRGRSPIYMSGHIISSNHLMKDPIRLSDILKKHRAVLAVEMEAAGVYEAAYGTPHYPVMAIRGISDIVGLERDSRWTAYACQTAAAFTYAFIMTDPLDPPPNSASFQKTVVHSEISSAQLQGSEPSSDTQHSVWHHTKPMETNVSNIATLLKVRKHGNIRPVLFLGARAGGLFRNPTLYEIIKILSEHAFDEFSDSDKFRECFTVLSDANRFSTSDIEAFLLESLDETTEREEDEYLVKLVKDEYFKIIITTNIDMLLESAFRDEMRRYHNVEVFVAGDQNQKTIVYPETKCCTIVKTFGDLETRRYYIAGNELDLGTEIHLKLKQFLEDYLRRDILVIGFDPSWDQSIEPAFPMSPDSSLWYVNEEPPPNDSFIAKVMRKRKGQSIIGTEGSYKSFIKTLYEHLMA